MNITKTNGKIRGGNVMEVSKTTKPKLIQLFENLLWVNSPKEWILKGTYFQGTLFISMMLGTNKDKPDQKIRRSFDLEVIRNRSDDLWGLAGDCVDEMRTEIKK